jgi:hypothetical protein
MSAFAIAAIASGGLSDARAAQADAGSAAVPAPPSPPAAPPAAQKATDRFALVWHNATFYTAPNPKARRVRAHDYRSSEHASRLDWVWPVKVISTDAGSGFVEVETPAKLDKAAHCYDGLEPVAGLRLRLFVRQADLALVTTRETRARRIQFPKGITEWKATARLESTGDIVLAPGVALVAHGASAGGHFLASVGDVSVAVAIDDSGSVGNTYPAVPRAAPPESKDRISLRMGSEDLFRSTAAFDRRTVGGEKRVTIRERCFETDLPVPPRRLQDEVVQIGMLGLRGGGGDELPAAQGTVRAGAKAYWPEGAPAGTVDENNRAFALAGPAAGKRRCFRVAVRAGWPSGQRPRDEYFLPLCFEPEDVTVARANRLGPAADEAGADDLWKSLRR